MRFLSSRDYHTFLKMNREIVNRVVDNNVVLYKINQKVTKTNSYGEATKKVWYKGVIIPCLFDLGSTDAVKSGEALDVQQTSTFYFLRKECELRKVYPEMGDIVDFNGKYYEIHTISESQLVAGREAYNHTIEAKTHLTRKSNLQLEPPQQ